MKRVDELNNQRMRVNRKRAAGNGRIDSGRSISRDKKDDIRLFTLWN